MKFMEDIHAPLLVFILALFALNAFAQRASGAITGRVVAEDGQPIPHAAVNISGLGGGGRRITASREIIADDDGNFMVDGLEPIPYLIAAWAPGYVPAPGSAVVNPFESNEARFIHVGESVTVKLIRGGVIQGCVTNDAGEPVISVPVRATRLQDEAGHPVSGDQGAGHLWTRTTDDRGIYRIYGLAPGSYIVAAGGVNTSSIRPTPFAGRTTTYHPSSTRDAATLVKVSSGVEATGIDIRYRGESGFAISGKIHGAPGATSGAIQTPTEIFLRSPITGETIATASLQPINNQNGYAFYGVPNGEYEVVAKNDGMDGDNGLTSRLRRVTVKGADVAGVDLTLTPNAAILGVVVIEKADSAAHLCESHREYYPEEIIVRARRDEPTEKAEPLLPVFPGYGIGIPYDKGAFTIHNLKSGRHRIELKLHDETLYLKAMEMTGAKPAIDPRDGLAVKSGGKLSGLRITIASGAASLKGKIAVGENAKLPSRSRIHLVPVGSEAKDDVLRFAETSAEGDGAFVFTNLAPGKYFALARAIPNSESSDKSTHPVAWDITTRARLRQEAEAANIAIELKPCQRIANYTLQLRD
jgi:Carboxypeptidase regulatory-like domain